MATDKKAIIRMQAMERGGTPRCEIADRLGVSQRTIRRLLGPHPSRDMPRRFVIENGPPIPPGEWITMLDASRLAGYKGNTSIRIAAEQLRWRHRFDRKTRRKMYRREDVESFIESRDSGKRSVNFGRSMLADKTAEIVNWANSLEKWPTDEEIAAMVTDGYDTRSVERVIWNRECREDGRWVDGIWVIGEKRRT